MNQMTTTDTVRQIMDTFAADTGLTGDRPPRRYLWTDAFAVCNYLGLTQQTGDDAYRSLALRLVDQVHETLGQHRDDDARSGWISGLDPDEGRRHPTRGGLRIGKQLPERSPDEPIDRRNEWNRDGQYYHYLTRWMHALSRVGQATADSTYIVWAVELAQAAHDAFVYRSKPGGRKRMYWKMSIDLSYPLVPSMGQHDPLDGLITYYELQASLEQSGTTTAERDFVSQHDFAPQIAELAAISSRQRWATNDPLGLGGLLTDAFRVAQLLAAGHLQRPDLLNMLLRAAGTGLASYRKQDQLSLPAAYRLAFRELGLAIGLHALEQMQQLPPGPLDTAADQLDEMTTHISLAHQIEQFWLEPAHQKSETWQDHLDINRVMLATSLMPDGYLRV